MKEKPFWLVWCENGGTPTKKHENFRSAEAEALRLARLHRGDTFVVLRSDMAFVANDVSRIDYTFDTDESEDVPS